MESDFFAFELVVKRNEIIQGHYRLSATAQKMAAAVLSRVNPMDSKLPAYHFSSAEMLRILGVTKAHYYQKVDEITDELARIVIRHKSKDGNEIIKSNMFLRSKYFKKDQSLLFEFHPDMKPYIIDFAGNFTQYQLQQIQRLRSRFAIRLYELLRKHHPISTINTSSYCTYRLDDLKGILGVEKKQYLRFNNFRVNVLERSQKELQSVTDLIFNFEPIRQGRKVNGIRFTISHNTEDRLEGDRQDQAQGQPGLPEFPEKIRQIKSVLYALIPNFPEAIFPLVANQPDAVITDSLMVFAGKRTHGNIDNPVSYFLGILQKKTAEAEQVEKTQPKSTEEKLLDRSWADGLVFDD